MYVILQIREYLQHTIWQDLMKKLRICLGMQIPRKDLKL